MVPRSAVPASTTVARERETGEGAWNAATPATQKITLENLRRSEWSRRPMGVGARGPRRASRSGSPRSLLSLDKGCL